MPKSQKKGPFQLTGSKSVYQNPWISVREDTVVRPDGKKGVFGVVEMVEGSTVLALDSDGTAYLTREYKYGLGGDSLEVISGGIDEGETPLVAAKRELQEELGLTANKWTSLGYINPFTTVVRSRNHLFLAQELTKGTAAEDELLEVTKVPFSVAIAKVLDSSISHGATCVTILKTARILGFD